jgi:hypothetical protein
MVTITATNFGFTWCSVVTNVMFNNFFRQYHLIHRQILFRRYYFKLSVSIIWEELYENYHYRTDSSLELRIIKTFEITRQICMNFSTLGRKFKIRNIVKFQIRVSNKPGLIAYTKLLRIIGVDVKATHN